MQLQKYEKWENSFLAQHLRFLWGPSGGHISLEWLCQAAASYLEHYLFLSTMMQEISTLANGAILRTMGTTKQPFAL